MACKRVPSYVVQPDEMAELMADIRMGDAVISVQRGQYGSESKKLVLKNAILERHGVTPEQFDTSLIWYGKNIGIYQEITQKSIDILEKRLKEVNAMAADEAAMSISGDSVDIWTDSKFYLVDRFSPSNYITFSFESDQNWESGDVYTLRSRVITPMQYAQWNLTATYDDGAIETITSNISLENPARQELTLVTDSTRNATRISGWINLEPSLGRPAILDSLSLMRRRNSPVLARSRKYSQKLIAPKINETSDTVNQDSTAGINKDLPAQQKSNSPRRKISGEFRKVQ